ncbi:MAG: biotin-dependent carboxyltransferase family protein [Clostridia bacterium]|nr:biotin-dependent carboxyltransferase family protein [Clostridia bacterium]
MLARIEIVSPGLLSSIQDRGRYGGLDYGVSESGAMDIFAYDCANEIVGNQKGAPAIEILNGSFKGLVLGKAIICVTGALTEMKINSVKVRLWENYLLNKGDVIELESCEAGIRNYLAVQGDWYGLDKFLDSYSTDVKAKIGGLAGRNLMRGDVLTVEWELKAVKRKLATFDDPYFRQMKCGIKDVRVLLGPQEEAFTFEGITAFFKGGYEMTTMSNRMGLRLKGQMIEHIESPDLLSDSIPFGAIQIPGDGQPIVMMADRQTTGGYTKIGTVVSTDLPVLAQTRPGELIRFVKIELDELKKIDSERAGRMNMPIQKKEETEILSSSQFTVIVNNRQYELLVEELGTV